MTVLAVEVYGSLVVVLLGRIALTGWLLLRHAQRLEAALIVWLRVPDATVEHLPTVDPATLPGPWKPKRQEPPA